MSENEIDDEYFTLLPHHVISQIINMAKCDLSIQSTSKEFNIIVSHDSKLHDLCTINTFPNIEKAFIHAAIYGKINILDEILNMDKSMLRAKDTQIIKNSYMCWTYYLTIQNAITYSNARVLSYLLKDDAGFEYRYWDCMRDAIFVGNIDIVKIVILASRNFKYEHQRGTDIDQPPEYRYNGQHKVWKSGSKLVDIDVLHGKLFIKSCMQDNVEIVKLFMAIWSESLDYIKALEVATAFKRMDIIQLLTNKENLTLLTLDDLSFSTKANKYVKYSYARRDDSFYKYYKIIELLIYQKDDLKIKEYLNITPLALSGLNQGLYKLCKRFKKIETAVYNYFPVVYK